MLQIFTITGALLLAIGLIGMMCLVVSPTLAIVITLVWSLGLFAVLPMVD